MLHDYPGHIERIQQALDEAFNTPPGAIDPFERALWALEFELEEFMAETRAELRAAEIDGNPEKIAAAREKNFLMGCAYSGSAGGGLANLGELRNFLRDHSAAAK
ncbi:TPA: hypothetical protein QEL15_000418 [Stenotrophomonas maltophilia]|nr:hypothetical protein [Stenotrophomonas maltophilia]